MRSWCDPDRRSVARLGATIGPSSARQIAIVAQTILASAALANSVTSVYCFQIAKVATVPGQLLQPPLWAKLQHDEVGTVSAWHSLADHSADVGAVFEAMLPVPTVARRLATLAGHEILPLIWRDRLACAVYLHDIGKANRGFRARWRPDAKPVGHIQPAVWLCLEPSFQATLMASLPLAHMAAWAVIPVPFCQFWLATAGQSMSKSRATLPTYGGPTRTATPLRIWPCSGTVSGAAGQALLRRVARLCQQLSYSGMPLPG